MAEAVKAEFQSQGFLQAHQDWVTSIVTNQDAQEGDLIISASRDRSIIIWKYKPDDERKLAGQPKKALKGHSHFISDLSLSNQNKFLLSSSWDKELRFWDLQKGTCTKRFVGNEKEIFSGVISTDQTMIIGVGADRKIKVYNTLGELKFEQKQDIHTDWISQIRFSPPVQNIQPYFVTVGWDGWLKLWNLNFQIRYQFQAHNGAINAVAINTTGVLIATGGRDKKVYVWNYASLEKPFAEFDVQGTVFAIAFHPQLNWVAAATELGVYIWQITEDQTNKVPIVLLNNEEVDKEKEKKSQKERKLIASTSLAFDANGSKIIVGFQDGRIRVWEIRVQN
ncbi:hypothetical protein pb186bvf_014202 [Paramecium bursaria]